MKPPREYTLSEVSSVLAAYGHPMPEEVQAVALLIDFLEVWQELLEGYIVEKEKALIAAAHKKAAVPRLKRAPEPEPSFDIDAGICVR